LHAKVRRALLGRKGPRRWDVQKYGVPINQEDLATVLLAFLMNSLMGCEMLLGFPVPEQERLDFLAFWRYVGWLLGVDCFEEKKKTTNQQCSDTKDTNYRPLDPCGPGWISKAPNPLAHALACSYSSMLHNMKPDKTSVKISHHILRIGKYPTTSTADPYGNHWFYFRSLQCRRFIGDPLADALQLPRHPYLWVRLKRTTRPPPTGPGSVDTPICNNWGEKTIFPKVLTFGKMVFFS
jgi:ER-bound oxygenase mpaB/B'/Rubber oxygenase, catalytic domain